MGSDSSKAGRNAAQQEENRRETFQYGPQPTTQNRASNNNNVTRPSSGPHATYPQARPQVPPVPPRSSDLPPSYSSVTPNAPNYAALRGTQSSGAVLHNPAPTPNKNPPRVQAPINNPPSRPPTTTIRQYCFGCNQITDHNEKNCPNVFCFSGDTFGRSDANCKAPTLQGVLQPEVLHSAAPSIPQRAAYVTAAPTATKAKQVPPKNAFVPLAGNLFNQEPPSKPVPAKPLPVPLPRSVSRQARGKQIDLSKDMPRILEEMKSNKLPSYQHFKQQLCKNKPIKDVRAAMVNNKYLSDVKFVINGSPFYAHKMALITSSFLFYDHFHTKGKTELNVEFIDIETFELLIKYCYSEQLKVTEDNVLELLKGANQLQIRQVTNVCHGFITSLMNADSIFLIFEKAMEIKYEIFQKKCLDFINNNEEKCFASKGFFAISLQSLMKVLQSCNYSREKENGIIQKWNDGGIGLENEAAGKEPDVKPPEKKPPRIVAFKQNAEKAAPKAQKKKQQPPLQKIPPCPVPYGHEQPLIPDLMSIPVPNPATGLPFPSPFPYEPAFMPTYPSNPQASNFANPYSSGSQACFFGSNPNLGPIPPNPLSAPKNKKPKAKPNPQPAALIVVDDGDDDFGSVNGEAAAAGTKIEVQGMRHKHATEFSRLDLFCTRAMAIHEIMFSENLAERCNEVKVTISALDQGKARDIHKRTVGINSGMRMNFIKFSRDPLKVRGGQKFSIKLHFDANVELINVSADKLSSNPLVELNRDSKKKYFNCVSSLTVSDMLAA